jgi:hypothetical protein
MWWYEKEWLINRVLLETKGRERVKEEWSCILLFAKPLA